MTTRSTANNARELRDAIIRYEGHVKATNETLARIDKRLETMNGKVSSHQSILDREFPRTIDGCPQKEVIEDLKTNMITAKAIKKTIYIGITVMTAVIGALWVISEFISKR